ncbi:hypothetical protein N8Z26_07830 [Burkholderiales bacterium]|nr:hypothetical protein [Burkholderiales bacterium]
MKITLILFLVCLSATIAYGQNRPGVPIETAKKIREARPSFNDLVREVDQLTQGLIELEIAITEADTARLRERNEDFRKATETRKENYEKVIELLEKIGDLKTDIATHQNSLVQLQNEFENRGNQLLQSSRDLANAEVRLAETEAQIEEMRVLNDERLNNLNTVMNVIEARVQSINAQAMQKTDYDDREKALVARILFLEEANQTLLQRFQVSETLIQHLGEQIINNTDQLTARNEEIVDQSDRINVIQKRIIMFEGLSDQLVSLAKKDDELEGKIIKIDDLGSKIETIVADLYLVRNELLRIDSDSKRLEDVSKLILDDLTAVLGRLGEVEINQISKLDSEGLNAILKRLDDLEIIQPELGDQYSLRDRVDELLYQQSLIAEEFERLNSIEDTLINLEERFDQNQMSSEVREETLLPTKVREEVPMTQYPAQPIGE